MSNYQAKKAYVLITDEMTRALPIVIIMVMMLIVCIIG